MSNNDDFLNDSGLPPFLKKAELAAAGERFCVTALRDIEREGKQNWYLDVLRTEGTEQTPGTITFERNAKRDTKMIGIQKRLQTQDALHGVWIAAEKTKKGATFYDLRQDHEAFCLCNAVAASDEEEEKEAAPF